MLGQGAGGVGGQKMWSAMDGATKPPMDGFTGVFLTPNPTSTDISKAGKRITIPEYNEAISNSEHHRRHLVLGVLAGLWRAYVCAVGQSLGLAALFFMSVVMMTSAGSTLDSTFTSLAKSLAVDLPRLATRASDRLPSMRVGAAVPTQSL